MSGRLCPLCGKADAIERTGHVSCSRTEDMSVSVSLPEKVCGRCGMAVAESALIAALERWTHLRGGE